ncbi:MAG: 16S rRNA (adenine(1518)-N(6)/adenine(1519)-N(6))-dimethyltransferase RsmA [Bacillales bacterium]
MLNKEEIISFFKFHNSHAKKELGQNFLINYNNILDICDLIRTNENLNILEIGPGLGAITNEIINKSYNKYTVVEYDSKFVDYLSKAYNNKKIDIQKGNILKYKNYDYDLVFGNLPYYITSEIILHIALNFNKCRECIYMMQKEAFQRITAKVGTKDYNVLNIIIEYVYDYKLNMKISRSSYFPAPMVDSVVVTFTIKNDIDYDLLKGIYKISSQLFINRRKTIFNNLNNIVKNKEQTLIILNELNLDKNLRPENLNLNNYIEITKKLINLNFVKL